MKRTRIWAFAVTMVLSLAVLLPLGKAEPLGPNGATYTDATNDVMSKVFALTVGNNRALYARDVNTPGALDLVSSSIETSAGIITFKAKVNGALPKPNAAATGPDGFPVGVTAMDFYFNWATDQTQANSMTTRQNTNLTCGDTYTQQKTPAVGGYVYRIDQNEHADSGNVGGCRYATEGPYHPGDGWNRTVLLQATINDAGNVAYSWSSAVYDPIEGITWTRPGTSHDNVECASLNPTAFTCTEPNFLPTAGGVPHLTPGSLNSANYTKTGALRTGTAWPGGTGYSNNEVVLRIPYQHRFDLVDDDNGKADEERVTTLMASGDKITGFSTALGAAVSVDIPPGEPLCYGSAIYGVTPILHDSELVKKDECFSYSAGTTMIGDWVPGNPFTNTAGAIHPGVSGAFGPVCFNGGCQPSWGGYRPPTIAAWAAGSALGTSGTGSYKPGLGAPFCRYPLGLLAGASTTVFVSGHTTRTVDDPLGGGTISVGKVGDAGSPIVTSPYPAVPHDPDGGDPGVTTSYPTGGDGQCFNIEDQDAGNWILKGTTTGFTVQ